MTKLIGTPFTDAEKKIALIKQLKDELAGVKIKYFGIEKELVDLMSLRDLIGHTDLKVTQEYLKVMDSQKKSAIQKFDII